ncbi:unnamed protein product [Gadus morhua 'NCC']
MRGRVRKESRKMHMYLGGASESPAHTARTNFSDAPPKSILLTIQRIPHKNLIRGLISDSDSQSYPPLEPQEDLQTVGHQLHHSVRQGDPIRPQKPSGPAPLDDSQDLQTVGNQLHHSVRLGDPFRTQTRRCPATLELQEDLKTVGNQPPHSVRLRYPFRTQTRRCPATLELQEDLQTVGNKPTPWTSDLSGPGPPGPGPPGPPRRARP